MSTSDPPNATEADSQKVSFKFCGSCSNLLYPVEDRQSSTLHFVCQNNCPGGSVSDGTAIVYRNDLSNKVGETAGMTQDISQDPTLPRIQMKCPAPGCDEREAVFFQSQQRTAETGMKLYYVCTSCGNVWQ